MATGETGLLIAIICDRDERLIENHLRALMRGADELRSLGAEILLLDDRPDPAWGDETLQAILPRWNTVFPCRIIRTATGAGFVRSANLALREAVRLRRDVLILTSDPIVFPGAIEEMARIARLDPMIGFVIPRSNGGSLANPPLRDRFHRRLPADAAETHAALAAHLPELTYIPMAAGFCLLIKWRILAELGFFDEIYGAGIDAANDLAMRAGRCGYRIAFANRAFVWCDEEGTSSSEAILRSRYPEFATLRTPIFIRPNLRPKACSPRLSPMRTVSSSSPLISRLSRRRITAR